MPNLQHTPFFNHIYPKNRSSGNHLLYPEETDSSSPLPHFAGTLNYFYTDDTQQLTDVEKLGVSGSFPVTPNQKLNNILATYEDLQRKLVLAMELRQTTQALLEQTLVDAISRTRFFTNVQTPFFPEEALFPDKKKLTFTITICAILIFSILSALTLSMFDRM